MAKIKKRLEHCKGITYFYRKYRQEKMNNAITLITPAHANPIALKRTIDSVKDICNEIVVGELCLFPSDKEMIESYCQEYNLKVGHLHFNYLYRHGFSEVLNTLAAYAANDLILYLNVGEICESYKRHPLEVIDEKYNCYYIDNRHEKHRWFRMYDRRELKWSGLLHEEIVGDHRPYHLPIMTFADTEKDTVDPLKAWVANDSKEIVYWRQLMRIVDHPEDLGATSPGWLQFAKEQYDSMKERMSQKGSRVTAFDTGNLNMYFQNLFDNKDILNIPFESTDNIEYQGSPKFLGK
jgi:hypothetical protein